MKKYVLNQFIIMFLSSFFISYAQASEIPDQCVKTIDLFAESILRNIATNDVEGYADDIIPSIEVITQALSKNSSLTIHNIEKILKKEKRSIATAKYYTAKMISSIQKHGEKAGLSWSDVKYTGIKSSYKIDPDTNEPSNKIEYISQKNNGAEINGIKKFLIAITTNSNKKYYLLVKDSVCITTTDEVSWYTYNKVKWYSNKRAFN